MKLVDILARELKVWPAKAEYCWQDYDRGIRFYGAGIGDFIASELSCEFRSRGNTVDHTVTRAKWQAAVDALKAPPIQIIGDLPKPGWIVPEKTADLIANSWLESPSLHIQQFGRVERKLPAWTGEGLPPVGTVCEAWVARDEWRECVVVALDDDDGTPVSVVRLGNSYFGMTLKTLRPIRTPEQTAATERESAIKAFMKIGDIYYCDAEKLYDAGARLPGEGKKA